MIVIDGNLFFNKALQNNLSYNDIGYHQKNNPSYSQSYRVPIERNNSMENDGDHEIDINSDAASHAKKPSHNHTSSNNNNFGIDKFATEINIGNNSDHDENKNEENVKALQPKSNQFRAKTMIEVAIIKEGYMKKEIKGVSKQWKKRWFVLQNDGKLLCYNNALAQHLMDTFPGNRMHTLMSTAYSKKFDHNKSFGILIKSKSKTWKLLCSNNKERMEWIKQFENVSGATHTW